MPEKSEVQGTSRETSDTNIRLLSKSEAAKMLGIGKDKLGKLITSGRIGFIQFDNRILIPLREIMNFIDTNTVRLSGDNVKQSLKRHSTRQRAQVPTNNNFNSISLFNKIMENQINGKHLQ